MNTNAFAEVVITPDGIKNALRDLLNDELFGGGGSSHEVARADHVHIAYPKANGSGVVSIGPTRTGVGSPNETIDTRTQIVASPARFLSTPFLSPSKFSVRSIWTYFESITNPVYVRVAIYDTDKYGFPQNAVWTGPQVLYGASASIILYDQSVPNILLDSGKLYAYVLHVSGNGPLYIHTSSKSEGWFANNQGMVGYATNSLPERMQFPDSYVTSSGVALSYIRGIAYD